MNDANGGEGTLSGFLAKVPLQCGQVMTVANMYVGENAPFDMLLGRPWQRGNFITIDERREGTFLVFKNQDLDKRWEMMVAGDPHPTTEVYDEYYSHAERTETNPQVSHAYLSTPASDILHAHIEEVPDEGDPTQTPKDLTTIPEADKERADQAQQHHLTMLESSLYATDMPHGLIDQELRRATENWRHQAKTSPAPPSQPEDILEKPPTRIESEDELNEAFSFLTTNDNPHSEVPEQAHTATSSMPASSPLPRPENYVLTPPRIVPDIEISPEDDRRLNEIISEELNCGGLTFAQWHRAARKLLRELFESDIRAITLAWDTFDCTENRLFRRQDDERMAYVRSDHRWDILEEDRRVLGLWMHEISRWTDERSRPSFSISSFCTSRQKMLVASQTEKEIDTDVRPDLLNRVV